MYFYADDTQLYIGFNAAAEKSIVISIQSHVQVQDILILECNLSQMMLDKLILDIFKLKTP